MKHNFLGKVKLHGKTREAVLETIRICKVRNLLKEYLSGREEEVISIMMGLFDQEKAIEQFGNEKKEEGKLEGRHDRESSGCGFGYRAKMAFRRICGKIKKCELLLFRLYLWGAEESVPHFSKHRTKLHPYCDRIASAIVLTFNFSQYTMVT